MKAIGKDLLSELDKYRLKNKEDNDVSLNMLNNYVIFILSTLPTQASLYIGLLWPPNQTPRFQSPRLTICCYRLQTEQT